jgi:hydrogen peroxide-dependent heme synthase
MVYVAAMSESPQTPPAPNGSKPIVPCEGLPVLHLFYHLNRAAWQALSEKERAQGMKRLEDTIAEARAWPRFTVLTLSMIAKADLGFMILGGEMQQLNALEKKIAAALGADVLTPAYRYFSMTEKSEYTPTEEEHAAELAREGVPPGTPEFEQKLEEFRKRIKHYTEDRMYPKLPAWECLCFYPMSKRRDPEQNWYALDFEERRRLMGGHAQVGRKHKGKIAQLVTGSTGLDDWEWGVTLLAHDPHAIKAIVYEMRFDAVSHGYAEFGPFYNGLVLTLPQIYERLMM